MLKTETQMAERASLMTKPFRLSLKND